MTFGYLLTYLKISQLLAETIVGSGLRPINVIIMIMVLYLFLGCFIDPAGILVLSVPVFFPIIEKLGFDPIWFGILATINMEVANITPPVGLNLFVVRSISPPEIKLKDIIQGSFPFVIFLCLGMAILMIWPEIALWLPRMMIGG
jgi:TRAP-type C4-dicarboxylate transport system permease large subunit